MQLEQLEEYINQEIKSYPQLEADITNFWYLACDEVASGESEYNECELAVGSIDELIKEFNEE